MELKKKRTFRKFTYRGIDLDNLLDLTPEQLIDLVHARARRRLHRGLKKKGMALLKKVRSSTALVRQLCASDGGSAAGNGGAGNGGAAARMVPRRRWPHGIAAKAVARPPRRHRFFEPRHRHTSSLARRGRIDAHRHAPCPFVCEQLRKAKKDCGPYDKPDTVKTHLRDMLIMPEMIGSVIGVHNGKLFTSVEVKADMVGMYLAEFSISYKPVRHGRPGIGATSSSKFVPLK